MVEDYQRLAKHDIRSVRDGIRWHLIETSPGRYDWRSFLSMLRAARDNGVQVIWDLCHYGWPDDIDIWKPEFACVSPGLPRVLHVWCATKPMRFHCSA